MLNSFFQKLDPVAFYVGSLSVYWYGITYLIGFLGAGLIVRWAIKRWKVAISDDDLLSLMIASVIGAVLGGRLGYVLFYGQGAYWANPVQIFAIRDGGMSFHGGLIGVAVGCLIVVRSLKIPALTVADLGALGAPIGFFFGRIANFINGELWGKTTTVSWGVVFPGAGPLPRHPSQLYEALLEGLVLFVVMVVLARKKPQLPRGSMMGWMLILYGVFRILVEFIREPDANLGYIWNFMTMGQILSVPLIALGIGLLIYCRKNPKPHGGRDGGLQR